MATSENNECCLQIHLPVELVIPVALPAHCDTIVSYKIITLVLYGKENRFYKRSR
jgi:hypothetical protein